jgi:hypothetical protein
MNRFAEMKHEVEMYLCVFYGWSWRPQVSLSYSNKITAFGIKEVKINRNPASNSA